jgi:RHS repeat-associated protein
VIPVRAPTPSSCGRSLLLAACALLLVLLSLAAPAHAQLVFAGRVASRAPVVYTPGTHDLAPRPTNGFAPPGREPEGGWAYRWIEYDHVSGVINPEWDMFTDDEKCLRNLNVERYHAETRQWQQVEEQQPCFTMSAGEYNALLAQLRAAMTFPAATEKKRTAMTPREYVETGRCLRRMPSGEVELAPPEPPSADVRTVVVRTLVNDAPLPCDRYPVLFTRAPGGFLDAALVTDPLPAAIKTVLLPPDAWQAPLYKSEHVITYQTAFVELLRTDEGGLATNNPCTWFDLKTDFAEMTPVLATYAMESCKANLHRNIYKPFQGANIWVGDREVETDQNGYYFYESKLVNQMVTAIATVDFDPFNPAEPPDPDRLSNRAKIIYEGPQLEYTGGRITFNTNFPIDVTIVAPTLRMSNDSIDALTGAPKPGAAIHIVSGSIEGNGPYADWGAGQTAYSFPTESNVDRGLLKTISVPNFGDTTIYVFRSSGSVLGSRWGLSHLDEIRKPKPPEDEDDSLLMAPLALAALSVRGPMGVHLPEQSALYQLGVTYHSPLGTACRGQTMQSREAFDNPGGSSEDNADGGVSDAGSPTDPDDDLLLQGPSPGCSSYVQDSLAGQEVTVIAQNHATGYLGMTRITDRVDTDLPYVTTDITMSPPNLRIWAERTRGGAKDSQEATRIGAEGAALVSDDKVVVYTDFRAADGGPLPANLPGYLGRIVRSTGGVVTDKADGEGAISFPIRPGFHAQVVQLPGGDKAAAGHYYVHVAGVSREEGFRTDPPSRAGPHGSFSTSQICFWPQPELVIPPGCDGADNDGDGRVDELDECDHPERDCDGVDSDNDGNIDDGCGQLKEPVCTMTREAGPTPEHARPWTFVPFKVAVFDRVTTEAHFRAQVEALKQTTPTNTRVRVPEIQKFYSWNYAPEYHFGLLDLNVASIDLTTEAGEASGESRTTIQIGHSIGGSSADKLPSFSDSKSSLLWGIGKYAVEALTGGTTSEDFDGKTLEEAASDTPYEVGYVQALDKLQPEDYLSLQLWQDDDPGNPLFILEDLPVALATPHWLVFERKKHFRGQGGEGGANAGEEVIEGYHFLDFRVPEGWFDAAKNGYGTDDGLPRKLVASLKLEDKEGAVLATIRENIPISEAGLKSAIIDYESVRNAGQGDDSCGSGNGKLFYVVLHIGTTDNFVKQRVRWPAKVSDSSAGVLLGQDIVEDVVLQDGTLQLSRTDFSILGAGPDLTFSRWYTNTEGDGADNPLGPGWHHGLEQTLVPLKHSDWGGAASPNWVKMMRNQIWPRDVINKAIQNVPGLADDEPDWNLLHVNGTTFAKEGEAWIPDMGRHGKLREVLKADPAVSKVCTTTKCFVYTSTDGTEYVYGWPKFVHDEARTRWVAVDDPTLGRLLATVDAGAGTPKTLDTGFLRAGDAGAEDDEELCEGEEPPPDVLRRYGEAPKPSPTLLTRDRFGNELLYEIDEKRGHVTKATDSVGRSCELTYKRLCLPKNPELPQSSAGMRGTHRLSQVTCLEGQTDPDGTQSEPIVVTFEYDDEGMLERAVRATRVERYRYETELGDDEAYGDRNLTEVISTRPGTLSPSPGAKAQGPSSSEVSTRYEYVSQCGNADFNPGGDFARALNAADAMLRVTRPATLTVDDSEVEPTTKFRYQGVTRTVERAHGAVPLTTTYDLYTWGQPHFIVEPNGRKTEQLWDFEGNCAEGDNVFGAYLCGEKISQGDQPPLRDIQYTYDARGNMTARTVRGGSPCDATAEEFTETTVWNQEFSLPTARTDANDSTEGWQLDEHGFVESYRDRGGVSWTNVPVTEEGKKGLVESTSNAQSGITTTYTYDRFGNLAAVTEPEDDDGLNTVTRFTYDARGRLRDVTDPRGNTTRYKYDALDAVEEIDHPDLDPTRVLSTVGAARPQTFTNDAVGNPVATSDRNGLTLEYEYTQLGQVSHVNRRDTALGGTGRDLRYDELGNLTVESDWAGTRVLRDHQIASRTVVTTSRTLESMTEEYDVLGQLVSRTDFAGNRSVFCEDLQGRPLRTRTERNAAEIAAGSEATPYVVDRYYASGPSAGPTVTEVRYQKDAPNDRPPQAPAIDADNVVVSITQHNKRYQPEEQQTAAGVYDWDYDEAGRLVSTTDETGVKETFDVNPRGRVRSITTTTANPAAGTAPPVRVFTYDANGNRTAVQLGSSTDKWRTMYDEWNRPYLQVDPSEHSVETWYDNEGNVVQVEDGLGIETWKRTEHGLVEAYTNAEGGTWRFEQFDPNGHPRREVHPERTYAAGLTVELVYDDGGRLEQRTESGDGVSRGWTYGYDGLGQITSIVQPRGRGDVIQYSALSQPVLSCQGGTGGLCRKWTYSGTGQVTREVNRNDDAVTYQYDGSDQVISAHGPLPLTTQEFAYDGAGRQLFAQDIDENVTAYHYDGFGRLQEVAQGDEALRDVAMNGSALPEDRVIARYSYDALGRVEFEQDAAMAARGALSSGPRLHHTYYANGQPFETTYPATTSSGSYTVKRKYNAAGELASVTVGSGLEQVLGYGNGRQGHQVRTSQIGSEIWTYRRNKHGEVDGMTSPRFRGTGTLKELKHDSAGRLASVEEADLETSYVWDDHDNLDLVTKPGNVRLDLEYDQYDRLTARTESSQAGTFETKFEDFTGEGDPQKVTDAALRQIDYTYDEARRPLTATYATTLTTAVGRSATAAAVRMITWAYKPDHQGQLESVTVERSAGADDVVSYDGYDAFNRPHQINDRGVAVAYDYDRAGNVTKVDVGGRFTSYRFDARGRMEGACAGAAICSSGGTTYAYLADDRLDSVTHPNGASAKYTYHSATHRVQTVTHRGPAPANALIASVAYTYDANGNVQTRTLKANGAEEVFAAGEVDADTGAVSDGYDTIDRLRAFSVTTTRPTGQGSNTEIDVLKTVYTFENYHRLKEVTARNDVTTTRDYHHDGERLKSIAVSGAQVDTIAYEYDPNGNLVRKSTAADETLFAWDSRDMLVQVTRGPPGSAPTHAERYAYDEVGWRTQRQVGTETVRAFWANGNMAQEREGTTVLAHYHHADGPFAFDAGDERKYYHQDALGTTLALTNDQGLPTERYQVGPFGDVQASGSDAVRGRFVFTGHEYDSDTKLTYARARYYDSETGNFLSQDPFPGGLSEPFSQAAYGYAQHNPARFTDPSGQFLPAVFAAIAVYEALQTAAAMGFAVAAVSAAVDVARQSDGTGTVNTFRAYDDDSTNYAAAYSRIDYGHATKVGAVSGATAAVSTLFGAGLAFQGASKIVSYGGGFLFDTAIGTPAEMVLDDSIGVGEAFQRSATGNVIGAGIAGTGALAWQGIRALRGTRGGASSAGAARFAVEDSTGALPLERVEVSDPGLATRGYRPRAGERNLSREEYRALEREARRERGFARSADSIGPREFVGPRLPDGATSRAGVAAGEDALSGQVAYGADDLSAFALRYRKDIAGQKFGGNVAAFEYEDAGGQLVQEIAISEGMYGWHSERILLGRIRSLGLDPAKALKRVFSEFAPCQNPGSFCAARLAREAPHAKVTYAFEYGGPPIPNTKLGAPERAASRARGSAARDEFFDELFGVGND